MLRKLSFGADQFLEHINVTVSTWRFQMCMLCLGQKYVVDMNKQIPQFARLHILPSGAKFSSRIINF